MDFSYVDFLKKQSNVKHFKKNKIYNSTNSLTDGSIILNDVFIEGQKFYFEPFNICYFREWIRDEY